MTVDAIMLEAEKLNDEELKNLEDSIHDLKKDRENAKRKKAVDELRKAWNKAVSVGFAIYDNDGYKIVNFEDLNYYF